MGGVVYTRVGTLVSTSPCYALSRSASTTTGHLIGPVSPMYDLLIYSCSVASAHFLRLQPGKAVSDKKRAVVFHSRETYTFSNYLAYTLYAPLYIAGPIITFNDFMWQVGTRIPSFIVPSVHVLTTSSHVLWISCRGRRRDTRFVSSFHYLLLRLSSTSCMFSRSKIRAHGVV